MAADKLAKYTALDGQFLRSVRLDADVGRVDALRGYVVQPTSRTALDTMSRHVESSQQRAFTWTGPYGGGKSSLALALVSLAGGESKLRRAAREVLEVGNSDPTGRCFGGGKPWATITVVGKRMPIVDALGAEIDRTIKKGKPGQRPQIGGKRDVIRELVEAAETRSEIAGVLVVVDELGKFLEYAAQSGDDIGFFQEMAEAASRCDGRLVIVGILHQAFEQYAVRLGSAAQQEWAKVQGRFVDIPLVAGTDEVIGLIGRALRVDFPHPKSLRVAKEVAKVIRTRRPGASANVAQLLDACWPIHPVTASLLGPTSKKRFGQNERSVFSFLASAEPLGLSEALRGMDASGDAYYWPAQFWDYLRTNFEPAILASPDSHRWAISADAIERTEARFSALHTALVKTVGLIELLRNGSGLVAEKELLRVCVAAEAADVETALNELSSASILIFRRHLGAYGVYAGSDFDIEAAIRDAKGRTGDYDLTKIGQVVDLGPVTARRHYWQTGAMRWFSRAIVGVDRASEYVAGLRPLGSQCGEFVLLVSSRHGSQPLAQKAAKRLSAESASKGILVGVPQRADRIEELIVDLAALEFVRDNSRELHGDSVAQTEVSGRLRATQVELAEELRESFNGATWYCDGVALKRHGSQGISYLASDVADRMYPQAPHVHSELINRNALSSAAAKAQRDLLHSMLSRAGEANLGYQSFSADAGLYYTVIRALGLYREQKDGWRFANPITDGAGATLVPAWEAAQALVLRPEQSTTLSHLFAVWRAQPFGIKEGLLPILALAFFQLHRHELALFIEGTFTPDVSEAHIDEWLQDADRIEWRYVRINATDKKLLEALAKALTERLGHTVAADALDSARALVAMVYHLPAWTRRTESLSERTRAVRRLLLNATDPHKVLFTDLPLVLSVREPVALARQVAEIAQELRDAFELRLRLIERRVFSALDHTADDGSLQARAKTVAGIGADFRLDAFASRLSTYSGQVQDLEGLVMLAVSKPAKDWTDHDLNAAEAQLVTWAFEFRRMEALAAVRGRPSSRQAIGVVFGAASTVSGTFDVSEKDAVLADKLAHELLTKFGDSVKQEILLAAVARVGATVYQALEKKRGVTHD